MTPPPPADVTVTSDGAVALAAPRSPSRPDWLVAVLRLVRRPAAGNLTFGLRRTEILSAQANGATLLVLAGLVVYEGIHRLVTPPEPEGLVILVVALVAVVVALVILVFFAIGYAFGRAFL